MPPLNVLSWHMEWLAIDPFIRSIACRWELQLLPPMQMLLLPGDLSRKLALMKVRSYVQ